MNNIVAIKVLLFSWATCSGSFFGGPEHTSAEQKLIYERAHVIRCSLNKDNILKKYALELAEEYARGKTKSLKKEAELFGITPFMWVVDIGSYKATKLLLKRSLDLPGAQLTKRSSVFYAIKSGQTALSIAEERLKNSWHEEDLQERKKIVYLLKSQQLFYQKMIEMHTKAVTPLPVELMNIVTDYALGEELPPDTKKSLCIIS